MTNQFGVRAWPTAPAPQIATRVVTPSEEVAVERVTAKRGGKHVGSPEHGRAPGATRGYRPGAIPARHGGVPRGAATARHPQGADNSPTPATPSPAPSPAAPQPAPPSPDPVAQARNDAPAPAVPNVVPPALAAPPPPDGNDGNDGNDGQHGDDGQHGHDGGDDHGRFGRGHGPVRHLLDELP
jgi:hypothetical protein